jgi:hypothetical protein
MHKFEFVKEVFSIVLFFGWLSIQAQNFSHLPIIEYKDHPKSSIKLKNSIVESWFSTIAYWKDRNIPLGEPLDLKIFPDSTVRIIIPSDQNPIYYNDIHLVGHTFFPQTPLFERQTSRYVRNESNLEIDSLRFPYTYIRQQDSMFKNGSKVEIIDTIYFQMHNHESLYFFDQTRNIYAIPQREYYKIDSFRYTNAIYEDTIFLNRSFETNSLPNGYRYLSIALDSSLAVKNIGRELNESTISVHLWYKPMQNYGINDTLFSLVPDVVPQKKLNLFGTLLFSNTTSYENKAYWNNPYFITKKQRYSPDRRFNLGATPSVKYFGYNRNYFFDFGFYGRFEVPSLSIREIETDVSFTMKPMPAGNNLPLFTDFKLTKAGIVTIHLKDIQGRTVKVLTNTFFSQGEHSIISSLNDIEPGTYICTLRTAYGMVSKKLLVH